MAKPGISKILILLPMIYIHIPPYALTSGIFCRNSYESVRMRRWHVLVKLANKISPPTLRGLKYSLFLMSESIYFYGVWVCHKRRAWIDPTLPKFPQYTQLRIIEQHLCRYMIFWCIQIFLSRIWPHIPDIYLANHHRDGAPGAWLYSVTLQRGATISTFLIVYVPLLHHLLYLICFSRQIESNVFGTLDQYSLFAHACLRREVYIHVTLHRYETFYKCVCMQIIYISSMILNGLRYKTLVPQ